MIGFSSAGADEKQITAFFFASFAPSRFDPIFHHILSLLTDLPCFVKDRQRDFNIPEHGARPWRTHRCNPVSPY
jgi:hypothetical protein